MGWMLYGYLISFLFWIPLTVLFLRIALPLVRAPFSDPMVGWIYTVTTPVLRPIERFVPRWRNLSLAAVLLLWLVASLEFALLTLRLAPLAWLAGGLGGGLSFVAGFLMVLIMVYSLFRLFEPRQGTSIVYLVGRMASPLCNVFRRYVPAIGPFDLSPAFAILALVLIRLLATTLLYGLANQL